MIQSNSAAIAAIVVLGIGGQWVAWMLRLPAIFVLLCLGILVGPGLGLINPDALFGDLLFPIVSLSVAVILFEGGLTLRLDGLRDLRRTVLSLSSVGVVVSWTLTTVLAYYAADFSFELALLTGAILVVTGPTVIFPMLRFVRPTRSVSTVLRWEGIVTDPIGAVFAVLVFEAIISRSLSDLPFTAMYGVILTLAVGVILGICAAWFYIAVTCRHFVPEYLENACALMLILGTFALSNALQHESGLLTVTIMGFVLANQQRVPIRSLIEFKENVRILIIAFLFIALSARLQISDVLSLGWHGVWFVLGLIFIVRPATVFLSTIGSGLSVKERLLISLIAPRGIVAAAVSSLLGLQLIEAGIDGSERFAPLIFLVIISTVVVYGLSSRPLANILGLRQKVGRSFLFLGAGPFARALGAALIERGSQVVLVDTNPHNAAEARTAGVPCIQRDVLDPHFLEELDTMGIGRFLALTRNDEINLLAALEMSPFLERSHIFKSALSREVGEVSDSRLHSAKIKTLFGTSYTIDQLDQRIDSGQCITTIETGPELEQAIQSGAVPLFLRMKPNDPFHPIVDGALVKERKFSAVLVLQPKGC